MTGEREGGDGAGDNRETAAAAPTGERRDRTDTDDRYSAQTRAGGWLFGDRVGLALFLGALCFGMLTWRAGIFITDNGTLARTLEALAEGRLWVEEAEGDYLVAPGAEERDGLVYGRNYGQLVASLPALFALRLLDAVADLRVSVVALWHLAGLGFAVVVSDLLDRRRTGTLAAAPVVLGSFLLNLVLATRLEEPDLPLLALQATALVVTALGATMLYRLLAMQGSRRVAVLAGAASVLALPVGFWAAIPKRHVFTVLAVLTVLYLFALSRRPGGQPLPAVSRVLAVGEGLRGDEGRTGGEGLRGDEGRTGDEGLRDDEGRTGDEVPLARAGAYAVVGLLTWVHAAEGLFVFVVLVAVDVPTAPRNDLRSLAVVGVVFGLSMLPTLATNLLVTGEFARPPRTLGGGVTAPAAGGSGGSGGAAAGGDSPLETLADIVPVGVVAWFLRNILTLVQDSLVAAGDPERLSNVFVRSAGSDLTGSRPGFIGDAEFAGANLSVLESAPVLALGVAAVAGWLARARERLARLRRVEPTVVLAVGLAIAFVALYLSLLPLYTQITQRYLLAVFPLVLYALARSPVVERLVDREGRLACWSYAAGVLVGGQLVLAAVLVQDLPVGEAAQLNAKLSLGAAALVLATSLPSVRTRRFDRGAAVAVGLACAAATVFVLVAHLHYFETTGEALLPVVEEITEFLSV
jgi:hypothetical protein